MREYALNRKSRALALRIVRLYKYLCDEMREFVLSKQLLRCGTSIGANIAEAHYAQSDADIKSKFYIALKEAGETEYWINLLHDAGYLTDNEYESICNDVVEIIKILSSSIKTVNYEAQ